MVDTSTLQEYGGYLQQQRGELEKQKQIIQEFSPQITQTQKQLMSATPMSQTRIQFQEALRTGEKEQALKEITSYEGQIGQTQKQYESYLKTPSGIYQYAKETGVKGTPILGYPTGEGKGKADKEWKSFHFTSYDNPFLPSDEIIKMKETYPGDRFAQECLGEFKKKEGLVYKDS